MGVLPRMLVAGAFVALASQAHAQQQGTDLKKEMIGQWELSTAERGKTCVITLRPENGPQGQRLALEPGCAEALPFTRDVVAWAIRGLDLVRLLDAKGQPVIDFSEVENGILEGMRQGEGVYLLQNLAAARASQRSMDQMIGDWSVVRGANRVLCGMTLTNNESTLKDNFQLFLKPRCDPQVANFKPVAWRLERGELLLSAANGDVWRFEADDNAQWRRVPDSADPMLLVRQ
jgi:hypothetical protein